MDERHIGWIQECVRESLEAIAGVSFVSESTYAHDLIETVLALGAHGECVIVGRGAVHILPAETTLRVRLIGPLRYRIAALSRRLGISEEEGARRIEEIDRERTAFIQFDFLKDPRQPHHYDQVLNVARLSISACADLIVNGLHCLHASTMTQGSDRSPS